MTAKGPTRDRVSVLGRRDSKAIAARPSVVAAVGRVLDQYSHIAIAGLVAVVVALAWANRFLQDDAYISFRYARNLAEGRGLVWNLGEHIEGYTNFLWTILIAAGMALRVDPAVTAVVLGLLFLVLTLISTYRLASLVFASELLGLLTVVILGTNYTLICYATGGLETQMQTALCVTAVYLSCRGLAAGEWSVSSLLMLSTLSALAVLTRMDSILACGIAMIVPCIATLTGKGEWWRRWAPSLEVSVPFLLIVGTWVLWKMLYYGHALPNTFYLKVVHGAPAATGLRYLHVFLTSYFLYPFVFLALGATPAFCRREQRVLQILGCICLLWAGYVVAVGGDFMEFRLLTPILPFVAVGLVWLSVVWIQLPLVRAGLLMTILAGSIHHAMTFEYTTADRIEPIRDLQDHLTDAQQNWSGIGRMLRENFGDHADISIATTAAGAIPYFSELPTIDMFGVNDAWVASNGVVVSNMPGHQRMAPLAYLVKRHVNLVISHPLVLQREEEVPGVAMFPPQPGDDERLAGAQIIEIPIDERYKLIVLYLTRHPAIDATIVKHGWTVYPVGTS